MFRNNYDGDTVTFSPTGRLFQVEYAMEAIKQGSITIGLRSNKHVVLVGLKRSNDKLSSYQKKIIKCGTNLGFSLSGLAPDARILANFIKQQVSYSELVYGKDVNIQKLSELLAQKAQKTTQTYSGRPYGVGLLIAGKDNSGVHLYEFQPTGNVIELYGSALGARSQGGKTYLENNLDSYLEEESLEELIKHGVAALKQTLKDETLTVNNLSVAYVGEDHDFTIVEGYDVEKYL